MCQFELLAPKRTEELDNLEKSIPYLFKAIEFAKQNKRFLIFLLIFSLVISERYNLIRIYRYFFLIYNASVIYWTYARIFHKPNFKRHLTSSLKVIVKALKEIDDVDYEWRYFLERTLIESLIDANQSSVEASALANDLLKFVKSNVTSSFEDFFEFIVSKNLMSDDDVKALTSSKWDLNAIYLIERLKKSQSFRSKKPALITMSGSKSEESMSSLQHNGSVSGGGSGDDSTPILSELENIYKLILPVVAIKYNGSSLDSSEFMRSSLSNNGTTAANRKEEIGVLFKRYRLMLNLASVCLLYDEINLCSQILGYLKEAEHMVNLIYSSTTIFYAFFVVSSFIYFII